MGNAKLGAQSSDSPLAGGAIAETSITDAELASNSVTTAKIADGAVTSAKISSGILPTFVASLPASPVDGQQIYYQANVTDGVIWHLRYRTASSSSYKWEFLGGSPLYKADNDNRTANSPSNLTFIDVPTDTIVLTVPLAGEYVVSNSAVASLNNNNSYGFYGYAITDAADAIQIDADFNRSAATSVVPTGLPQSIGANNIFTISTAGFKLRERAAVSSTHSLNVYSRRLLVVPIRVG